MKGNIFKRHAELVSASHEEEINERELNEKVVIEFMCSFGIGSM